VTTPSSEAVQPVAELPTSLKVEAWADPVIDKLGHDPRSRYVELYWLGVLGPSTTWLLRRLADRLDAEPDGFDLDLQATATGLGLGMKNGRHSPFMRAIDRACQFGLARKSGHALGVRRVMPPVTQGQLKRLPPHLQSAHSDWQAAQLIDAGREAERKARRLALTLLELGEDIDSAERQLCSWRVEGPTAHRALLWAHNRHLEALAASKGSGPDAA
jgi:hypothetical protein